MTEDRDDPREIDKLKARLEYFEEMARWNLFVLDLLGALGDFYKDAGRNRDPRVIFKMASHFLKRALNFRFLAFYVVDEPEADFVLADWDPLPEREFIQKEMDCLVDNGIFSWALNQNRSVLARDNEDHKLILHVLATKLRIRGMFIGMIPGTGISHESLNMLSIIIHYVAHALEGASLYGLLGEKNQLLEEIVEQRTQELRRQTVHLQNEIEERKRREKELRGSESRIRALINSAADGIITIDESGTVESINPVMERIFGYKAEELLGKSVNHLMPEPYKSEHDGYIRNYLRAGESKIIGAGPREVVGRRKDGAMVPLELTVSEILLDDRRLFLGILRDIGERKRMEEELRKHRDHLEELVEKRTAELETTHRKLRHSEKLFAVGKLAASLAHEFNNPIYGIRNILEQVGEEAELEEDLKALVELASRECNRVTGLIGKLRDVYRPSTDIRTRMDIHEALDDMILLVQKKLRERKITLEKHYDAGMSMVEAVPDQIKQVILNLLQNAEESIPDEGGKIVIVTENAGIDLKIHIRDTGHGIPPEDLDNIFEPFFSTKAAKGTGLGLSVSYGIVKSHGGEIEVDSQLGKGTVFTITLPVKEAGP